LSELVCVLRGELARRLRIELAIAFSTIAQWVGQTDVQFRPLVDALSEPVLKQSVIQADETPVQMLAPGEKKAHRAYVWSYSTTSILTLDFSPSRAGEHARNFLGDWNPLILGLISERYLALGVPLGRTRWLTPLPWQPKRLLTPLRRGY